ncbi:hypothetical protein QYF36_015413 [Acer negundo]|nr:hypothetical protein QYF36_015413 [Acer negundo]
MQSHPSLSLLLSCLKSNSPSPPLIRTCFLCPPVDDHESLKPFYLRPRLGLDGLFIRTHLLESPSKCISPPIVERRRTKALDDRPGKGQLIRSYPHPKGISSNLRSALLISHSLCSELSAVHRSELSKAAKRSISLTQPYQIRRGCHASLGRRRTKRAKLFCILRAIKQSVQSCLRLLAALRSTRHVF